MLRAVPVTSRLLSPMEIYFNEKNRLNELLQQTLPDEFISQSTPVKVTLYEHDPAEKLPSNVASFKDVPLKAKRSRITLLARALLKLAGNSESLENGKLVTFFDDNNMALIVAINFDANHSQQLVANLNQLYPTLEAAVLGHGTMYEEKLPFIFLGFSPQKINQIIIPTLKMYLEINSDILTNSECSSDTVTNTFSEFFENFGISTEGTDIVEETMHAAVRHNLKWNNYKVKQLYKHLIDKGLPVALLGIITSFLPAKAEYKIDKPHEIVTTNSLFSPNFTANQITQFKVTTSLDACKHIEVYFNNIIPDSVTINPVRIYNAQRKCDMTVINIKNQALLTKSFINAIEDGLRAYTQAQLDAYRKQSKSITYTTSDHAAEISKLYANCVELTKADAQSVGITTLLKNIAKLQEHLSKPEFKFALNKTAEEPRIVEIKDEDEKSSETIPVIANPLSEEVVTLLNAITKEKDNIFGTSTSSDCKHCAHCNPGFFQSLSQLKQNLFRIFNNIKSLLKIENMQYKKAAMSI